MDCAAGCLRLLCIHRRFCSQMNLPSLGLRPPMLTCVNVWSNENPSFIYSHCHQQWQLSIWAGVLGNCLIAPHISVILVSNCHHLNFLSTCLSGLLEDMTFSMHLHMWFQHIGALPHHSHEVQWRLFVMDWPLTVFKPAHSSIHFISSLQIF